LRIVLFIISFTSFLTAQAQTAEELMEDIQRTTQLLTHTLKNQTDALDSYFALQRQLEQRAKLIQSIQSEITSIAADVEQSAIAVDSLEIEMSLLQEEYAIIMRQAFRQKKSRNDLLFLFSANSLNQALKRWRYLQQYQAYRKKQIQLLLEAKLVLQGKIKELSNNKSRQEQLLLAEENQIESTHEAMQLKGTLISQLRKEQSTINKLLEEQKQAHQWLSESISSAIKSDLDEKTENKSEIEEGTSSKKKPKDYLSTNLTYEFIQRKGGLVWPIKNGIIVRHFGSQPHPIHKKIRIDNNGIDIRARSSASVYALFDGIVTAIQVVPGYKNTLILQHGDFYSVYSNLEIVKVKKGDVVLGQQVIGTAGIPPQKSDPELHLEIWKGKQRLNPFPWLKKL